MTKRTLTEEEKKQEIEKAKADNPNRAPGSKVVVLDETDDTGKPIVRIEQATETEMPANWKP